MTFDLSPCRGWQFCLYTDVSGCTRVASVANEERRMNLKKIKYNNLERRPPTR